MKYWKAIISVLYGPRNCWLKGGYLLLGLMIGGVLALAPCLVQAQTQIHGQAGEKAKEDEREAPEVPPQVIKVYLNQNKPPKYYFDQEGKPKGILVDVMRSVDDLLPQYDFQLELLPWKRAYHYAKQGRGAIIGISKNKERMGVFDFSEPVFEDSMVLVTLIENAFEFHQHSDLTGKVLGSLKGASFGEDFERAKEEKLFLIEEDSGPVVRLKKLLLGRIDVALLGVGPFGLFNGLQQDKLLAQNSHRFQILNRPFNVDPNFFAYVSSAGKKEVVHDFNLALRKLKLSGRYQQILDRYLPRF